MNNEKDTYRRLMRRVVQDMSALKPDSDEKLRKRLNKKFAKYAKKAGFESQNGTSGNQNN